MSIIQDALRRKDHERIERPEPTPPPAPASAPASAPPPPRPDVRAAPGPAPAYYAYPAPAPRRAPRGGGHWVLTVFLVLVLIAVSGGTAWFFFGQRGTAVNLVAAHDVEPAPPEAGAPGPEAEPEDTGWPPHKLGSLAQAGENSSAFHTGKLDFVGDDIDGAVLVEVEAKGVTLENQEGERRFLKQGDEIP